MTKYKSCLYPRVSTSWPEQKGEKWVGTLISVIWIHCLEFHHLWVWAEVDVWLRYSRHQQQRLAQAQARRGDLRGATQDEVGGLFYCNYRIYIVLRARVVQLYNRVALKRDQAALYHDEGLLPPCLCLQATAACQVMICLEMAFVCCCWVFSRNNLTASTRYSTMLYIYKAGTYTCQK